MTNTPLTNKEENVVQNLPITNMIFGFCILFHSLITLFLIICFYDFDRILETLEDTTILKECLQITLKVLLTLSIVIIIIFSLLRYYTNTFLQIIQKILPEKITPSISKKNRIIKLLCIITFLITVTFFTLLTMGIIKIKNTAIKTDVISRYYDNNNLKSESNYIKGVLNGTRKLYYPNRSLQKTIEYEMGKNMDIEFLLSDDLIKYNI